MDAASAQAHLQTIRTLMERAALYRRALAPVMALLGLIGITASIVGFLSRIETFPLFMVYWMSIGIGSVIAAFLIIRRQAMSAGEAFWSPPARRVAQGILPPLVCGMFLTLVVAPTAGDDNAGIWRAIVAWTAMYGCALHAGGFFTEGGLQRCGWAFILTAAGMLTVSMMAPLTAREAHLAMGFVFGGLHLAYSAYLRITEKKRQCA